MAIVLKHYNANNSITLCRISSFLALSSNNSFPFFEIYLKHYSNIISEAPLVKILTD